MNAIHTIYYARPHVIKDYALRTRTGEANTSTEHEAAELLRETAKDARFLYDSIGTWASNDVAPTTEDFEALASIVFGFSKVMDVTADVVDGDYCHWAVYADMSGRRERMGTHRTRTDARTHAEKLKENHWRGVEVEEIAM